MTVATHLPAADLDDGPAHTRPRRPHRRPVRHKGAIVGFLAPFVVLFVLFYVIPIGYAVYQSLFKVQREGAFGAPEQVFGGFTQYALVFQSHEFWSSVLRVLGFFVISVPIQLLLALVFALLLDSASLRAPKFFRLALFAPYAVPGVIAALTWGFLYGPSLSPFTTLVEHVHFLGAGLVIFSIANVVNWVFTGYNMLILYSSLKAIPPELYEAARMDGATQLRTALSIKIPLIAPALILTGVFSIIGTLQLFNEPTVFRNFASSVSRNYTPNMVVYATSNVPNYNLAAAYSVVLAVATSVLSFTFLKVTQRRAFQ